MARWNSVAVETDGQTSLVLVSGEMKAELEAAGVVLVTYRNLCAAAMRLGLREHLSWDPAELVRDESGAIPEQSTVVS